MRRKERGARAARGPRRRALAVSLAAATYAILTACSAPEYRFASTSVPEGGLPTTDGAPDTDTDAVVDASTDMTSEPPPPAAPLDPIVVGGDGGASFSADCNAVTNVYAFVGTDDVAKRHCYLYFPSAPYKRTWPEAKVACGAITTPSPQRVAHLATFPGVVEANAVQTAFKSGQVPWIGLELTVPSAPTAKDSFHWVTGEPNGYDGWSAGAPSGAGLCVAWAGNSRWDDVPCETGKGLLCELDE
jgi:hypothetical protein